MIAAVAARLSVALFVLTAAPAFAGPPFELATCGQTYEGWTVLTKDLDCSGTGYPAVNIKGRLDLNGHTITGADTNLVVHCFDKRCKINGPGTITGAGSTGVLAVDRLAMRDVTITGTSLAVNIASSTRGGGVAELKRCTITDNEHAIFSVVGVKLVDTTIAGNHGIGVWVNRLDDKRCGTLQVKRSSVTGLADGAACGVSNVCADLTSCGKPKLVSATCGTSCQGTTDIPCTTWGVCSND